MNYKIPKDLKKRMERELRQYDFNKRKLDELKQKNNCNPRRLLYFEERLEHVETVYMRLKPQEQEVYKLIFKNGCNWLYCQTMYNIDKHTFYDVYNKSLYYLAEEFGEI